MKGMPVYDVTRIWLGPPVGESWVSNLYYYDYIHHNCVMYRGVSLGPNYVGIHSN